jgi:hypothetical protein
LEDLAMRSSPILALRVDKLAVTQRFAVTIFLNQQAYLWQVINAVSIRHQRPFRAATASDDNAIVFHQGTFHEVYRMNAESEPCRRSFQI